MAARQLQLLAKEPLLPLAQRPLGQLGHEMVETDLAHRDQARVARVPGQCRVQARQRIVRRRRHIHRVQAQRVGVAKALRQRAHGIEGADFDGGNHAGRHARGPRPFAHRRQVGRELGRVQVAVGVDPGAHGRIMPECGAAPPMHKSAEP